MDLQSVFYIMAIIFMVLMIGILVSIIYFMWSIWHSAQNMKAEFVEKTKEFVSHKQNEFGSMIGLAVATFLVKKARSWFNRRSS